MSLSRRFLLKTLPHNQEILFKKNRRIPILKDKSMGLIKWQKAGLENLLVSPCLKRRIKGESHCGLSERRALTPSLFIQLCTYYSALQD